MSFAALLFTAIAVLDLFPATGTCLCVRWLPARSQSWSPRTRLVSAMMFALALWLKSLMRRAVPCMPACAVVKVVGPQFPQITELLLKLSDEVASSDMLGLLAVVVAEMRDQIAPLAAPLMQRLVREHEPATQSACRPSNFVVFVAACASLCCLLVIVGRSGGHHDGSARSGLRRRQRCNDSHGGHAPAVNGACVPRSSGRWRAFPLDLGLLLAFVAVAMIGRCLRRCRRLRRRLSR